MKNELKIYCRIIKAALIHQFPNFTFEIKTSLIDKGYDVRSFRQTTLDDFFDINGNPVLEDAPINNISKHMFVTINPKEFYLENIFTLYNNLVETVKKQSGV
tara:strand:- start:400 stop:705 length:306 start_codon:yes stop_codon:yes gene_type:complete